MKKCGCRKIVVFIIEVMLMTVGFVLIPPLLDKCTDKLYKIFRKRDKIDFERMGAEIIPHDKTEK